MSGKRLTGVGSRKSRKGAFRKLVGDRLFRGRLSSRKKSAFWKVPGCRSFRFQAPRRMSGWGREAPSDPGIKRQIFSAADRGVLDLQPDRRGWRSGIVNEQVRNACLNVP